MKPRSRSELYLHQKFESINYDSGLTGQEKRQARRAMKRGMSKTSRHIDDKVIRQEIETLDEFDD